MNNIFQYVLLDKNTVRKKFDMQTLVYPSDKLLLVYYYTMALEQHRLLQLHASEIPNSFGRITLLKSQLEQLRIGMALSDDLCNEFKPIKYLDSTVVTIESFFKMEKKKNKESKKGSSKLFPRMFRRRLRALFKELHTYKFYEEHYHFLSDGAELLLKSAYYLRKRVPVHFQIDSEIKWSHDEIDNELAFDYFRVLERLKTHEFTNRKQLSYDEVTSILTDYFSSNEVMSMGIEVKDLNLDTIWSGYRVEKLIGEAFVIGKNPEEFITIFEGSHAYQYVTVVTGPHFGHAFNRDIVTVKIENEDSLKVVVNEWFKSGID